MRNIYHIGLSIRKIKKKIVPVPIIFFRFVILSNFRVQFYWMYLIQVFIFYNTIFNHSLQIVLITRRIYL